MQENLKTFSAEILSGTSKKSSLTTAESLKRKCDEQELNAAPGLAKHCAKPNAEGEASNVLNSMS